MSHRFVGFFQRIAGYVSLASTLAGPLGAQSTVKPLPKAAQPSELAWTLARAYSEPAVHADFADASEPAASDDAGVVPRTTLTDPSRTRQVVNDDAAHIELELQGSGHPSTNLQSGGGSVDVVRAGWDARAGWRTGDRSALTVGLHSEASFYGFSGATGLVPGSGNGSPLNDVYETSLGSTLCVGASENTAWFTSAALTLGGEDNASLGGSLTVAAVSGMRYQAREDLAFDIGLAVMTHHEGSPWVIPYLGFDWRVSDRVRFGTNGSQVHLAVDLNDAWTLSGEAAYKLREYRLNDENPLPGGAFRDQEIDLGLALEWRPSAGSRVRFEGGVIAWRELEMYDSAGDKVSEIEADPVPYAAFSLQFGF